MNKYRKDLDLPEDSESAGFNNTPEEDAEENLDIKDLIKDLYDQIPMRLRDFVRINYLSEINIDKLKAIESGEIELTDNLFFELLRESPQYLICRPFQKKIELWRAILFDPTIKDELHDKAADRLKDIGNSLSFIGSGRKSKVGDQDEIYSQYTCFLELIKTVLEKLKKKNPYNIEVAFKEELQSLTAETEKSKKIANAHEFHRLNQKKELIRRLSKYDSDLVSADKYKRERLIDRIKSPTVLAKEVTAKENNISPSSVEKIINKYKKTINPYPPSK